LGGTGTETLVGVDLLGEGLAVIGVENLMPLHRHLVVGGEVGALDGGETGIVIVTTITGGYHHLEGTVIPHRPGVVDAAGTAGTAVTVEEAEEGQRTQDLAVHPAETPDTIESAIDPYRHAMEALCGMFN